MAEDKYPRITQAQFEIWMAMPATKRYLQCLKWEIEHAEEDLKPVLNPNNSDASHAYLFELQGFTTALEMASDPLTILKRSEIYDNDSEEKDRLREAESKRLSVITQADSSQQGT